MWVEKYRPNTLDDYVVNDATRSMLKNFIQKDTMCNLLLAGKQGIGKTSLANVITHELDATVLYINASVENGVDVMREKVVDFTNAVSLDGKLKIVVLDEADSLTGSAASGSSAQSALRNIIENCADDTRFILTCNYANKIIDPLKSRCTEISLSFDVKSVLARCMHILKAENVSYTKDSLTAFAQQVIKKKWPDFRAIINILEQCSNSGELIVVDIEDDTAVGEIIKFLVSDKNINEKRQYVMDNDDKFDNDYPALASKLFEAYFDIDDNNATQKQIVIGDCIYQMSQVIDVEIVFYYMLMRLQNVK